MATQYNTGQSPRRDCLSLLITCAHFPGEESAQFPLPVGVDGRNLEAFRVNTYIGKPVRPTVYHAAPEARLHLFRTEYDKDLYYICELQSYRQRYTCSCGVRYCDHVRFLQKQEVAR